MTLLRLIAATVLLTTLTACDRSAEIAARIDRSPAQARADAVLSSWADRLVKQSQPQLIRHFPPVLTVEKTYRVDFLTADTSMFRKKTQERSDRETVFSNQQVTERWTQQFCSQELREIMQSQGIKLTIGGLVEPGGVVHSVGVCKL